MRYWGRYLGESLRARVCFLKFEFRRRYVKQIMAESRSDVPQVIEVPVTREKGSSMNLGNLLLVGGLGYVLLKTFLLEERVNDLTVLLRRQSLDPGTRSRTPTVAFANPVQNTEDEYETSDGDDDEPPSEHSGDEEEEDEVRIEEQPREVPPPAELPPRPVAPPSGSAFVTTRQRRSGSELRRDSSRAGASA